MPVTETAELPLFPLQTVLFPGGLLSLKVFEARYLDLVSACLREARPFGVVALRGGTEVQRGGEAKVVFETIGVLAELLEVDSAQAGILQVRCRGTQRFMLSAPRQQADGLWLAARRLLPDDAAVAPAPAQHDTVKGLANAIASLKTTGGRTLPHAIPLRRCRLGREPLVRDPADLACCQAEAARTRRPARAPAARRRVPARQGRRQVGALSAGSSRSSLRSGAGRPSASASSRPNQRPLGQAEVIASTRAADVRAGNSQRNGCSVQSRCVSTCVKLGSGWTRPGQSREAASNAAGESNSGRLHRPAHTPVGGRCTSQISSRHRSCNQTCSRRPRFSLRVLTG